MTRLIRYLPVICRHCLYFLPLPHGQGSFRPLSRSHRLRFSAVANAPDFPSLPYPGISGISKASGSLSTFARLLSFSLLTTDTLSELSDAFSDLNKHRLEEVEGLELIFKERIFLSYRLRPIPLLSSSMASRCSFHLASRTSRKI